MADNTKVKDSIIAPSTTLEAVSIITNAPVDEHLLVVYDSLESFRELYLELARRLIEKNNQLFIILTYYETPDNIRLFLRERGINVSERQRKGSLLIIDAVRWFSDYPMSDSFATHDSFVHDMVRTAKEKGMAGVTIMQDMGLFFLAGVPSNALTIERDLPNSIGINPKLVCCYHAEDFDRFDSVQKKSLVSIHENSISITSLHNLFFEEALAEAVNDAIKVFGKQASTVIVKYLQDKHSVPPQLMSVSPEALEEALVNALDSGARIVERKILRSLYEKIGSPMPSSSSTAMSDFQQRIVEVKRMYERQNSIV